MTRLHLLFLLLVLAIAVPFATADTITLTNNNFGAIGPIGTVNVVTSDSGVEVTLTANSGFAFVTTGGADILFNTSAILTSANISNIMINGAPYTGTFSLLSSQTRAGSLFSYDLTKLQAQNGVNAATSIQFFISGVTLDQFESSPGVLSAWGVHACFDTGGNKCTGNTGFTFSVGTPVPEPGTLSLLGTGLVGLAGFFRRRLLS